MSVLILPPLQVYLCVSCIEDTQFPWSGGSFYIIFSYTTGNLKAKVLVQGSFKKACFAREPVLGEMGVDDSVPT